MPCGIGYFRSGRLHLPFAFSLLHPAGPVLRESGPLNHVHVLRQAVYQCDILSSDLSRAQETRFDSAKSHLQFIWRTGKPAVWVLLIRQLSGLAVIRAFDKQATFEHRLQEAIDTQNVSCAVMFMKVADRCSKHTSLVSVTLVSTVNRAELSRSPVKDG